jgi:hypothetical protein
VAGPGVSTGWSFSVRGRYESIRATLRKFPPITFMGRPEALEPTSDSGAKRLHYSIRISAEPKGGLSCATGIGAGTFRFAGGATLAFPGRFVTISARDNAATLDGAAAYAVPAATMTGR